MTQIQNSAIVLVKMPLTAVTSFQFNINIPFSADEIIIKQIAFSVATGTDDCYSLRWDGIGDLFLFGNGAEFSNPDIRIKTTNRALNGLQTFSIWDGNFGHSNTPTGVLGFVFEAIKY